MYTKTSPQPSFSNFLLPFEGELKANNPWIVLADLISWDEFEAQYAEQFHASLGAPAKSLRLALGALVAKERLQCSDRELVQHFEENLYLQYFLGLETFHRDCPFDDSSLTNFRKYLGEEVLGKVNEAVVAKLERLQENQQQEDEPDPPKRGSGHKDQTMPERVAVDEHGEEESRSIAEKERPSEEDNEPAPAGKLVVDATCAPADIAYPVDVRLLHRARLQSEALIDELHAQRPSGSLKPRTYRQKLQHKWRAFIKIRKPSRSKNRAMQKILLMTLQRNMGHIDTLLDELGVGSLKNKSLRRLWILREFLRQQLEWFETGQSPPSRIVSLAQPHIRPIFRGKANASYEFGAKVSLSVENGFVMLHASRFENFNESGDLIEQIREYRRRKGHSPASVHADQIYRTRKNREFCKRHGIRLSGPPLGRPPKDEVCKKERQAQPKQDLGERNIVEGKIGQAKRRFSLARVLTRLAHTSKTTIALVFLVINLEKALALGLGPFYFLFFLLLSKFKDRKILLESRPEGTSAGFLRWFCGLVPKSTQSLKPALAA